MRRQIIPVVYKDYYCFSAEDAEKSIRESCETCLKTERSFGQNHNVTVVCDPNFMSQLFSYLNWGERTPLNYLEDAFHISGEIYKDNDKTVIIPRFLVRVVTTKRSKTSVVTTTENKQFSYWQNHMISSSLQQTDYYWLSSFAKLEIIGHGHTHPDLTGIGTRPSNIDWTDHMRNFRDCRTWLSLIVDPINRRMSFYFGEKMEEPDVVYMFYPDDAMIFNNGPDYQRIAPETVPVYVSDMPVIQGCEMAESININENDEVCDTALETAEELYVTQAESQIRIRRDKGKKQRRQKKAFKKAIYEFLSGRDDYEHILAQLTSGLGKGENYE